MTGICLVTSLTETEWANLKGGVGCASPSKPMPKMPNPTYRDPAKTRKLDTVITDLRKIADREPDLRAASYIGMTVTPGWRILFSNGHFAVCEQGPSTHAEKKKPLFKDKPTKIGKLDAAAWRAYAPVRPFANERTEAITWTFTEDRLTFHTAGQPDLGEASAWHPGRFVAADLCLSDTYLWPCRGRDWTLAQVSDALILTDKDQTTQIVVMGMRR